MIRRTLFSSGLTALLLVGLVAHRMTLPSAADAQQFNQEVRAAVDVFPGTIGTWRGKDVEMPRGALAMLRPNAVLSRLYTDDDTGRSVSFMLIHCGDARDMVGHYPPVCYPANGWTAEGKKPVEWRIGKLTIPGVEHHFHQVSAGKSSRIVVANVIMLPGGEFAHTMRDLSALETDYEHRFFGAAQLQFVFDERFSPRERRGIVEQFFQADISIIEAIQIRFTP